MSLNKLFIAIFIIGALRIAFSYNDLQYTITHIDFKYFFLHWQSLALAPVNLILIISAIIGLASGSQIKKTHMLKIQAISLFIVCIVAVLIPILMAFLVDRTMYSSPLADAILVGFCVHTAKRSFYKGSNPFLRYCGWISGIIIIAVEAANFIPKNLDMFTPPGSLI